MSRSLDSASDNFCSRDSVVVPSCRKIGGNMRFRRLLVVCWLFVVFVCLLFVGLC